jgi:hypothetical protein
MKTNESFISEHMSRKSLRSFLFRSRVRPVRELGCKLDWAVGYVEAAPP